MYTSCPSHVNACHTDTQSFNHYRTSVITIVLKYISSVTLVAFCFKTVSQRVMLCLVVSMVYVVVISNYSKCVIIISSSSQFNFLPHLAISSKILLTNRLTFTRPRLNYALRSFNTQWCYLTT